LHTFTPPHVTVIAIQSEKHRVIVTQGGVDFKIFQVQFAGAKGGVFIHFPYFSDPRGFVARAPLLGGGTGESQVEFQKSGELTSQRLKYSHHADGHALFSQDRKVFSRIRKKTTSLDSYSGHMFTVMFHGLEEFRLSTSDPPPSKHVKESAVKYSVTTDLGWMKIVGYWFSHTQLLDTYGKYSSYGPENTDLFIGPSFIDWDGIHHVILRSAESIKPFYRFLVLKFARLPTEVFDPDGGAKLIFLGAFDSKETVRDISKDSDALIFMYPVSDYDALSKVMTSIDFTQ